MPAPAHAMDRQLTKPVQPKTTAPVKPPDLPWTEEDNRAWWVAKRAQLRAKKVEALDTFRYVSKEEQLAAAAADAGRTAESSTER